MDSIKRVSHLSRRAKRRLYCKLQLWMWRKRRQKCFFGIFAAKRRASKMRSRSQSQKNKRSCPMKRTLTHTSALVPRLTCATEVSENMLREQTFLLNSCETDSVSEALIDSSYLGNHDMETNVAIGAISQTAPAVIENSVQCFEIADALELSQTVKDSDACGNILHFKMPRKVIPCQRLEVECTVGQHAVTADEDWAPNIDTDERIIGKKSSQAVSLTDMTKGIHEFLDDFYRRYGSFIPLQKSDVLRHLERKFNMDFSDRNNVIISEVTRYQTGVIQEPVPVFQMVYKKHTLTLDDLLTLADQNWLNDQVMNMYGELIMESAHQKVHFLNSFFHRQLMTKGYDGVKRWTKQVDLFSKSLLLVPIHLEVHWCLVTADIVKKRVCLYDSQGNAPQKVARNILKYLMTEAKEKQQTDFESGWTVLYNEKVPQQTNENDCGVFVLEYCRCLALSKPLQFSQNNIPKIRKRIYKELCELKLHEEDTKYTNRALLNDMPVEVDQMQQRLTLVLDPQSCSFSNFACPTVCTAYYLDQVAFSQSEAVSAGIVEKQAGLWLDDQDEPPLIKSVMVHLWV